MIGSLEDLIAIKALYRLVVTRIGHVSTRIIRELLVSPQT
jgi:hypothetical protein